MKMSKLGYFAEFFLFPPLVAFAALLAFRGQATPKLVIWTLVYCGGLVGWTLIEYVLHRLIFHHAPVISRIHDDHHRNPRELIGTPAWASVSIGVIGVASPAWASLGFALGTAAAAGLVTGYLWYVFVHYATHHFEPRRGSYLYRARLRHNLHHHMSDGGNFGVTTGLWDRLFGTAITGRKEDRAAQPFESLRA